MMKPLAAALVLSSCASVVPETAARLAALDPPTADPSAIELVLILPPGLSITPGSARLAFGAQRGEESLSGNFVLEERPVAAAVALPEGATAHGLALTGADAARMRALQAEIAAWQREGAARGRLGLGLGGCALGDGPAPDAVGSVLIRTVEGGRFQPLLREVRLAGLLGPDVLAAMRPCTGTDWTGAAWPSVEIRAARCYIRHRPGAGARTARNPGGRCPVSS